jgi:hypothetical protein
MLKVQTINTPILLSKQTYLFAIAIIICGLLANFFPAAVIIPFAIAAAIYFWKHQDHFVLFLIAYTPLEEIVLKILPNQFYTPVRFLWEGLLFGLMFILLFNKLAIKRNWIQTPIDLPLIVFLSGWIISGFINNVALSASLVNIKNLIRYIPLFYIIYNLTPKKEFLSLFIKFLIIIAAVQSILCLLEAADPTVAGLFVPREVIVGNDLIRGEDTQLGTFYTRFSGTLVRNVNLGNYLAFALCFIMAFYPGSQSKSWLKSSAILIALALFISSSRMSWLSAYAGIGTILLVIHHRWRYYFWLVPVATLLGIFVIGQFVPKGDLASDFNIISRFFYIFSSDYIDTISNAGRLYAIFYAMPAVLMTNPLFGLGPGAFIQISKQISSDDAFGRGAELGLDARALNFVHDVGYASLFAQVGLIGLGAFIWVFIRLYKIARNSLKNHNDPYIRDFMVGAIGFFVALMVQNLGSFNLMYRNQSLIIWVVAGLVALFAKRSPHAENPDGLIASGNINTDSAQ